MSVLDAFLATWSNARSTFGQGTPQSGAQFDNSATLRQLESGLASAGPGSQWTGTAASAYDAANTEHRRVLGQLAGLDQRLRAHVDQSSEVVSAGRRQLDEVRKWVADAAASVPTGVDRERMLMPIVQRGLSRLSNIVTRANGDLNAIGAGIRGLGDEFQALGNQKFGAKEGPELAGVEDKQDDDQRKKAEQDVQDALAGDQDAAERVEDVLGSITPGQELTAEQGSYLSQMQAQQHGMSVGELATAEERLGDHKNIIADSWQLMSNDDVRFPRTEAEVGALDDRNYRVKGAFDQLPQSVQDTLRNAGDLSAERGAADLARASDLNAISGIVKDGNAEFQMGTELDREMMRAADAVMDRYGDRVPVGDVSSVAEGIFESAGRDHQIVHDHLLGTHGDDGDDFLHDVNQIAWGDNGEAAATLFSWTNENHLGPEAGIASATAEKYATYIGSHRGELMHLPDPFGDKTLGQVNPELVKGYAHGLTPYMADIASVTSANPNDNFGVLDPGNSDRPIAKGLFAVLGTQQDAYVEFNGAADQLGLERAHQYAEDVKHGIPVQAHDVRLLEAAVLKGLVATGTAEGLHAIGLNSADAADWRKLAYNSGVEALAAAAGPVAGVPITSFGGFMESSIIGPPPDTSTPVIPNMGAHDSARFVLNALLADGVPVDGIDSYLVDDVHHDGTPFQRIGSLDELAADRVAMPTDTDLQSELNGALERVVGLGNNPAPPFAQKYEDIIKILDDKR